MGFKDDQSTSTNLRYRQTSRSESQHLSGHIIPGLISFMSVICHLHCQVVWWATPSPFQELHQAFLCFLATTQWRATAMRRCAMVIVILCHTRIQHHLDNIHEIDTVIIDIQHAVEQHLVERSGDFHRLSRPYNN